MEPKNTPEPDYKQLTQKLYAAVFPTVFDFLRGQQHPAGQAGETRDMIHQASHTTLLIVEDAMKPVREAVKRVQQQPTNINNLLH